MRREVRSTYRVQLHSGFTFDDVARIAAYLSDLGVTHVYCSPYLQAAQGSTHGYDVTDHTQLNEELGGAEAFERMVSALDSHGLGHIVDIVPNHVSTEGNPLWWDVLKHGKGSRYAAWFDIDWDYLDGKVCAPLLGDTLEACLERSEITLDRTGDEPVLRYFDHVLPLAPSTNLDAPLADVIDEQNYWLVEWRRGNRNINYRRFFDINTLAAVQVQNDEVFEHTHRSTLDLIDAGKLDGLRVDHIDGLFDPQAYLERLKSRAGVPVWVEKILEPSETLPDAWPVEGTTGYDFLNLVGGLFVNPAAEHEMTSIYQDLTGETGSLDEIVRAKKMLILRQVMIADLKRLAGEAERVFEARGWEADEGHLMATLAGVMSSFDVYRTYFRRDGSGTPEDQLVLRDAFSVARKHGPFIPPEYLDRLEQVLKQKTDALCSSVYNRPRVP